MLTPARDADEAYLRLGPDLQEISDFISTSRLSVRERMRLANMLAQHFVVLARQHSRPGLRLVPPARSE
jgi:hypothetical protein